MSAAPTMALPSLPVSPEAGAARPGRRKPARRSGEGEISRAYQVRIYPTPGQAEKLGRWIGCCRYIWNWGVELQDITWKTTGHKLPSPAISRALTELRKDPLRPWLAEVPRACLEQVLRFQDTSWSRFFKGCASPGLRPGKPRFHGKSGRDAVRIPLDSRRVEHILDPGNGLIHLTGLGAVACRVSEPWLGHISAATIRKRAGKWFATLTAVQVPARDNRPRRDAGVVHFENHQDPAGIVGVDVGISARATCSDGTVLDGTRAWRLDPSRKAREERRAAQRLRYERQAARQRDEQMRKRGLDPRQPIPKGTRIPLSHRAQRVQQKIAVFDLKAAFSRNDAIHRFTTDLVQRFHTIVVETLALHAMAKSLNRSFRRRMHEAAMGEVLRQLEYKCALYGRTLVKVERWFPSSRTCSTTGCGFVHRKLRLSTRSWVCPHCRQTHDRDRNAAVNLCHEGLRLLGLAPKASPSGELATQTAGSAEDGRRAQAMGGPQHHGPHACSDEASSFSHPRESALKALAVGMEPAARAMG